MKGKILILGLILVGLQSCNQSQDGSTDLIYEIHIDKRGETIQEGDYVALYSVEKTEEDSILFNSYEVERPVLLLREKPLFKGDFNTALGLLSEGDSATFKINVDSVIKTDNSKIINTKGKYLIYTVKIQKVIPRDKLNDSVFNSKIEAFHKSELEAARKSEPVKLLRYITSRKLKPIVTKSGLNYVVLKAGRGVKAAANDTVLVKYSGKLLSGKVFETTDSILARQYKIYKSDRNYGPMKLPVVNPPLSGFQEALSLFSSGTKAELIIPSGLAYGDQGNFAVKPYTPISCEIEIIDIIPSRKRSL